MPYFTNFPKPYGHVHPLLRLLIRELGRTQISVGLWSQSFISFMVKPPKIQKTGRVVVSEESTELFPSCENFNHKRAYTINQGTKNKHSTLFSGTLSSVPALEFRLKENSQRNELEKDGEKGDTKLQDERRGTAASLTLHQSIRSRTHRRWPGGTWLIRHVVDPAAGVTWQEGCRAHIQAAESRYLGHWVSPDLHLGTSISRLPLKCLSLRFHKHVTVLRDLGQFFVSIWLYFPMWFL